MFQTVSLAAGVAVEYYEEADFFRLMATDADLSVTFVRGGVVVATAETVSEGYAEKFDRPFDRVQIKSATAQVVTFVMRIGGSVAFDAPPTGAVTLSGTQGPMTQAAATVTSASALLIAAKAIRKFLLVQNKDPVGNVYINIAGGVGATLANGIKIAPGGSAEFSNYVPNGAIYAIGDIASNANVVTVEG